jgi:hypothetical protein
MGEYQIVVDEELSAKGLGRIDSDDLRRQLDELVASLGPVMDGDGKLGLSSLEVGLTLSAEGKVAFLAKAGLEATITLKFER